VSPLVVIRLSLPRRVGDLPREEFLALLWERLGGFGLVGIHEGTVLSEDLAPGDERSTPWILDGGLAPSDRDWVAGREDAEAELYFSDQSGADLARLTLARDYPQLSVGPVEVREAEDWNKKWKDSFTGARVPPFWEILPPWVEKPTDASSRVLRINPGAGFGTGTHETTQLCLTLISGVPEIAGARVLDFGSGSGILSIGAALLGAAHVVGCEIDELANDNARDNAGLNALGDRVEFRTDLPPDTAAYDIVIANILRPILLEFCERLCARLKNEGVVVLSGLLATDAPSVEAAFLKGLSRSGFEVSSRVIEHGEWRGIILERKKS
jgi:ribosomal protein L11 methyltransferase